MSAQIGSHAGGAADVDAVVDRSVATIRALAMDMVEQAGCGHPGTAMALAPLGYALFRRLLRANPADPGWPDRDRFVLSAGHACALQYALLHLAGYDLTLEDLRQLRQWGSRTPGHPERGHTPGVEVTTGPLGQGLANAVGMAIAQRFLAERYNRPGVQVVDHSVYVICSDGDLMEGVSHEAASVAGHLGLGELIVCYDDNGITIDGPTAISFDHEDQAARFESYGWHVQHVADAEDVEALERALRSARLESERPSLIVVRSRIAYPAPSAVDTSAAHGAPLGADEIAATKVGMGLDPDRCFVVDNEVYEHMSLASDGAALQAEWQLRFDRWSADHPRLREEWDRAWAGRLEDGWHAAVPSFPPGERLATRAAGGKVMAALSGYAPTMLGGAADLVESTRTQFRGAGLFSRSHAGRNVAFGVREHAMGGIVNGAAAHGGVVKPYGSTFLVFSDYMRPSVRLSALMGLAVVWVFTHDSIGLGEDGPTHQPVEHYLSLRAVPGLWVIRPGDANETAWAWRVALERQDGPVALLLSRQAVPTLDRTEVADPEGVARGGYVLWDSHPSDPELVLIATGSELAPTLEAGRLLAAEDVAVRVVSMPCLELFESQPASYRNSVLPADARARLAVEPGVTAGWWRWVGDCGDVIGLDRFGASAPGERVLAELGFTAENIAVRARRLLATSAESKGNLR